MDTSNPAVFVNAELLRMYVGRRVPPVIQVLKSDCDGLGRATVGYQRSSALLDLSQLLLRKSTLKYGPTFVSNNLGDTQVAERVTEISHIKIPSPNIDWVKIVLKVYDKLTFAYSKIRMPKSRKPETPTEDFEMLDAVDFIVLTLP